MCAKLALHSPKLQSYARFDGNNHNEWNVKPGCVLTASWPANYGGIYFGADNCLYDSTGESLRNNTIKNLILQTVC